MEDLVFKTVHASVRPARIAVLVDESDADWQIMCRGAIEFLSGTWGGEHALIVPTDGRVITPTFWSQLEAFDPDYIWRYGKSGRDIRRSRPDEFAAVLEREVAAYSGGTDSQESLRKWVEEQLEGGSWSNWHVAPELEKQLKDRLAPFFVQDLVSHHSIVAGQKPDYPLTPIATILPFCSRPEMLTTIKSTDRGVPQLWIEAVTGSMPTGFMDSLQTMGIPHRDVESNTVADLVTLF